ncbi:MAG: CDP-diacylglycerol--serine O-phosphatidyltransferase [Prevotella sp.]|nr:CDP-diacylglycerol--serine O-phosphatidyltransferase [Bacteroides sp.]MCM1366490.1 CDP-diacylglycerol--serine O-phosphatidyltransferase [Prevotella sp.]MCM1436829.1 CDP-diacylglycerol--serine O-phosphatidyltransferase [Prevotella sp.]
MNILKKNIPNALTCLNLLSGIMAIIFSFDGISTNESGLDGIRLSWICIGVAALADFFDGFAARKLGAYSDLGKELDSLSDNVSFGVAPAIVLMNLLIFEASYSPSAWIVFATLIIPVCGAIRLARFNVDDRQTTGFIGLPIPANAIFWIGYMALISNGVEFLTNAEILLPIIILESWLMVSNIPMLSLKFKTFGWKGNEPRWILIAAAVVMIATIQLAGLMWLIVFYVCLSIALNIKNR